MKTLDIASIRDKIQALVNAGEITFMGDNLVYHSKSGAYRVGTEDDLVSVWNLITAYQRKDGKISK